MERQRLEARVLLGAVVRQPALVFESIRAYFAMRRRGTLVPSSPYLAWRSHTAYGDDSPISSLDLAHYLTWRRNMRRIRRGR